MNLSVPPKPKFAIKKLLDPTPKIIKDKRVKRAINPNIIDTITIRMFKPSL